jgi:folylpolyglutamate synthase/dihydropteroate synthase
LSHYIIETYGHRLPLVVGVMSDKNIDAVVAALAPSASHFVFTAPATTRAASPADLASAAARVAPHIPVHTSNQPLDAVALAATLGSPTYSPKAVSAAGELQAPATFRQA